MKRVDWIEASLVLVNQHLQWKEPISLMASDDPEQVWQELEAQLVPRIQYLLDRDMNKLMQICYRIDLSEQKVNAVLSLAEPGQLAVQLARLILQREYQKVETRMRYSTPSD